MEVNRHVHINGYKINDDLDRKFLAIGFFRDPFKELERRATHPALVGTRYMPPHHYSFETESLRDMDHVFDSAVEAIENGEFEGYVESETIPGIFNVRYDPQSYDNNTNLRFPFSQCELIPVPVGKHKAVDIHTKRPLYMPRDELDDILLNAGCYEVHTPRSRIFTLQFQSVIDGESAYRSLNEYFSKTSGIKHMYLEITRKIHRVPRDFELTPFVRKGFFSS